MKYVHWITIRVFLTPSDDVDKTKEALSTLLITKEDETTSRIHEEQLITPEEAQTTTNASPMTKLSFKLTKQQEIKYVVKQLRDNLSQEQRDTLISQHDRVDNQCRFFLRLEKEPFIYNQEYLLTQSGSCIHFTFLMASYPATKTNALSAVHEVFS